MITLWPALLIAIWIVLIVGAMPQVDWFDHDLGYVPSGFAALMLATWIALIRVGRF